jgi:UDP-2-acetamido-3-amino-2,3-dideoxy-glucuronate N-acetyltransferase
MNEVFIDERAVCATDSIGGGSRVGAFTTIRSGAKIGNDCEIGEYVVIESDVTLGNRVKVKPGVQLWNGIRISDDVVIGPNATFTNEKDPRRRPEAQLYTHVREGSSIGANATILPGLTIGANALIGAGAVVTGDVPPFAIIVGNPGRIVGYVNSSDAVPSSSPVQPEPAAPVRELAVPGVKLYTLKVVRDLRGSLSVGEFERDIPFTPKRYFLVFDVPSKYVRGEHAHRQCHQFLICVKGSCAVMVDDGNRRDEVLLNQPNLGLHLRPMVWGVQYKYSPDAVLLVFASHYYDSADYIRNYDEFVAEVRSGS